MIDDLLKLSTAWPLLLMVAGATLALALGLFLSVDLGSRLRVEWMGAFFVGVPLSLVAGVIITRRDLSLGEGSLFRPDIDDVVSGNWVSRGITLVCIAIAIERLVRFILRREYRGARGLGVVALLLTYIGSANFLSAFFGTPGGFTHHLVYAPIIALAVFAYAQQNSDQCVLIVRNTLMVFLLASLIVLAVRPEMVAETRYRAGLIPGITLRFYGFATHPNTLAPLCLLLLCGIRLRRFKAPLLNIAGVTLAFVCLFLTQSKTSIGLVLIGAGWFWLLDRRESLAAGGPAQQRRWQGLSVALGLLVVGLLGLVVLVALSVNDSFLPKLSHLVDRLQLTTLTGRTRIWDETLRAASQNWIFGYGPELWSVGFRIKVGLPFTHAHNQFIHAFGAAGVVGVLALVAYLAGLARLAWRTRVASRGVTAVLFLYLLLRGLTELPINISNAMQGEFIVQIFLLVVCIGASQPRTLAAAASNAVSSPAFYSYRRAPGALS